jgi:hypothetical protein
MRFLRGVIETASFRTLVVFAGGNLLVAVLGGLGSLIQALWIEPAVFGEFRKFCILTAYMNIGLVLVNDGLSRQFPYLLGKGNKDGALKVAASAKWWYLLLCWLFSLFFAVLALTSVTQGDYRSAVGWGTQIPCIWTAIYGLYLGVMYRTSTEFERLSYNNIISNVFGFAALVLVRVWGYWGLAARVALASTVGLYCSRRYVPVRVKAALDVKALVDLAKISLPLAIPGYIGSSFLTASLSVIVLQYCGQHGLGIYGMALTFQAVALTLTGAIHQMFTTKLTYKFGETGNAFACLKYSRIPTLLSVGAACCLAVALCLVIGPFIRSLMPKYEPAVPVIRILALQLPVSAAGLPLIIIPTALWYKHLIALTLIRFLVPLAAIAVLPKTLNMIAACIILGGVCHVITGLGIVEWMCRKEVVPVSVGGGMATPN